MVQKNRGKWYFANTKELQDTGVYGPYLDLIGPYPTKEEAQEAERKAYEWAHEEQKAREEARANRED